jgi:uncharacterized protein (TIGR02996 family)
VVRSVTYAILFVHETERDLIHRYVIGELQEVFANDVIVGSDPSCDVIIDDPRVRPFAAEFTGRGHHMYARQLPDGRPERGGQAVPVGPFEVSIGYTSTPHDYPANAADLPIRFGPRCHLGTVPVDELPMDPRATEVARLAAPLADQTCHVRTLDADAERWCEDKVREYFAALSWVTAPLTPLVLQRIEYASPSAGAVALWTRAWQAVQARPFDPAAWAHIQRFDRWRGQFSKTRSEDYHDAEHFISPLHRLLTDNTRERNRIAWPMYTLLCTHVATFEDDVSPARPLADLITRGVFPFALPGNAVLLILDSCADAVLHSSDPAGNRFLHVLARSPDDLATRTVYADYLEHRGDSARADAIRVGALGPPRAAQPVRIFPEGASLLIYRDEDHPPIRDVAAEPPHAYLELGDRLYPLGVATAITYDNDKLAIGPLVDPARGVQLIHADGAIWISVHEARPDVSINGCLFGRLRAARPLFDGEVLDVRGPHDAITAIVRLGR